jgi:hypothetical protein
MLDPRAPARQRPTADNDRRRLLRFTRPLLVVTGLLTLALATAACSPVGRASAYEMDAVEVNADRDSGELSNDDSSSGGGGDTVEAAAAAAAGARAIALALSSGTRPLPSEAVMNHANAASAAVAAAAAARAAGNPLGERDAARAAAGAFQAAKTEALNIANELHSTGITIGHTALTNAAFDIMAAVIEAEASVAAASGNSGDVGSDSDNSE